MLPCYSSLWWYRTVLLMGVLFDVIIKWQQNNFSIDLAIFLRRHSLLCRVMYLAQSRTRHLKKCCNKWSDIELFVQLVNKNQQLNETPGWTRFRSAVLSAQNRSEHELFKNVRSVFHLFSRVAKFLRSSFFSY